MSDATEALVSAQPEQQPEIALVAKRTYDFGADGVCSPSEEQIPLVETPEGYEELELPLLSPPNWDFDLLAFKPRTDVVLQGSAYSYGGPAQVVDAELQMPGLTRTVRVYGDRTIQWHNGTPKFSKPVPFDQMPLRYDRAYGGCDVQAYHAHEDPVVDGVMATEPNFQLEPFMGFHYPRNPSGAGFVMTLNEVSSQQIRVPNLEFPDDAITPGRLAIGQPDRWLDAPLPACFDWSHASWFPRIGYLGLTPEHAKPQTEVAEVTRGWAVPDILTLRRVTNQGWHPDFQQGASPGMSTERFKPGTVVTLRNLHPKVPELRLQVAAQPPEVEIIVGPLSKLKARPQLNALVIRPDEGQVVEVWSSRSVAARQYHQLELDKMSWTINWN